MAEPPAQRARSEDAWATAAGHAVRAVRKPDATCTRARRFAPRVQQGKQIGLLAIGGAPEWAHQRLRGIAPNRRCRPMIWLDFGVGALRERQRSEVLARPGFAAPSRSHC